MKKYLPFLVLAPLALLGFVSAFSSPLSGSIVEFAKLAGGGVAFKLKINGVDYMGECSEDKVWYKTVANDQWLTTFTTDSGKWLLKLFRNGTEYAVREVV